MMCECQDNLWFVGALLLCKTAQRRTRSCTHIEKKFIMHMLQLELSNVTVGTITHVDDMGQIVSTQRALTVVLNNYYMGKYDFRTSGFRSTSKILTVT